MPVKQLDDVVKKIGKLQYIPRNKHTVFALLCFVVVIHWLIFPYPSGLLHWHCGNLTIAPVLAKQPWWIWINTSCEFIMNDCITATKQSTSKPCAYFLGYTVTISRTIPTTKQSTKTVGVFYGAHCGCHSWSLVYVSCCCWLFSVDNIKPLTNHHRGTISRPIRSHSSCTNHQRQCSLWWPGYGLLRHPLAIVAYTLKNISS